MLIFKLPESKNIDRFLDEIEEKVIKPGFSFVVLEVDEIGRILRNTVESIKKHFDIFIITKLNRLVIFKEIEMIFSFGIHGIYFSNIKNFDKKIYKILKETSLIFPKGMVFSELREKSKEIADELIKLNIIPVSTICDIDFVNYIKSKVETKKSLKNYLKFVSLFGQLKCNYNFKERIERKMMLEINNFRQKLMTKNIGDSFESSSL